MAFFSSSLQRQNRISLLNTWLYDEISIVSLLRAISHVTYYIPPTLNQSVAFVRRGVCVLPPLVERERARKIA